MYAAGRFDMWDRPGAGACGRVAGSEQGQGATIAVRVPASNPTLRLHDRG